MTRHHLAAALGAVVVAALGCGLAAAQTTLQTSVAVFACPAWPSFTLAPGASLTIPVSSFIEDWCGAGAAVDPTATASVDDPGLATAAIGAGGVVVTAGSETGATVLRYANPAGELGQAYIVVSP
jgi:hypothetical protein